MQFILDALHSSSFTESKKAEAICTIAFCDENNKFCERNLYAMKLLFSVDEPILRKQAIYFQWCSKSEDRIKREKGVHLMTREKFDVTVKNVLNKLDVQIDPFVKQFLINVDNFKQIKTY